MLCSRRVEFRDTDAAGIMHFSTYFTYMEEAEHELFRRLGTTVMQKVNDEINDQLAARRRRVPIPWVCPFRG